VKPLHE